MTWFHGEVIVELRWVSPSLPLFLSIFHFPLSMYHVPATSPCSVCIRLSYCLHFTMLCVHFTTSLKGWRVLLSQCNYEPAIMCWALLSEPLLGLLNWVRELVFHCYVRGGWTEAAGYQIARRLMLAFAFAYVSNEVSFSHVFQDNSASY